MRDHVILMQQGNIVQEGTLSNQTDSVDAASATGNRVMNFLPLIEGEHGAVIEGETSSLPVAPKEAAGGYLGLRPDAIELHPASAMGMPAKVLRTERWEDDTMAHVAVGPHVVRVRLNGHQPLDNQACKLTWSPALAQLFDAQGARQDTLLAFALSAPDRRIPRPPRVGSFQH